MYMGRHKKFKEEKILKIDQNLNSVHHKCEQNIINRAIVSFLLLKSGLRY